MLEPSDIVRDALPESATLEFKRALPSSDDRGRHEFLKDVCAFANSGGGSIFYGIAEENGAANDLTPVSGTPYDETVRRLGQILDASVEPRLNDVTFRRIEIGDDFVLEVKVRPSFAAPHRFNHNNHYKFVLRNNTHVTEMSYDQLRNAFTKSGRLIEVARDRWASDIGNALKRSLPRPLPPGPICLIQLVPMVSLENVPIIDVHEVHSDFGSFMFSDWGGASNLYNLDGVVFYRNAQDSVPFFTQVHRTSKLEAYRTGAISYGEEKLIPSQRVAEFFREAIQKFGSYISKYDVPGPYVINAAIVDVTGYRLALDNRLYFFEEAIADRNTLILPTQYFEEDFSADYDTIARSMLDVVWQSFGIPTCNYYNSEGSWIAR